MIPPEKTEAVTRGLREAFGVTEFDDIRRLTGGHTSALVYRIVVRGTPYVLRLIMRADDPTRHFACMKAAAEAGLAPHVWYTSIEDKVSITGFVEAAPFSAADALVRMPGTLRSLHALPPFAGVPDGINTSCMFLLNKGPALDGFLQTFQAADILSPSEIKELFARYAQVSGVYSRHDADMVSSHNDLFKPDNILFDGDRVWLIDWEAAFLNDRYADLAVVANLVVTNDADERSFLEQYLGEPPDRYQLARLILMRQLAHMFYTMGFLLIGSSRIARGAFGEDAPANPVDSSEKAPDLSDFHRRMWAGRVNLRDNSTKIAYGKAHWEQLQRNVRQAPYEEALKTVSDRGGV